MSTATAKPKLSLDNNQRAWLKKMGVALEAPIVDVGSKAAGAVPAGPAAVRPEPPKDGAAPPPSEPSVAGKPVLKQGCKGQDVKDLQTLLNKHGATLKDDGDFGKLTDAAVREFQKKNPPLKVDGIVGPQTWAALAAGKQEPPKPEDTKPRRAVIIVTDTATNDAIKNAAVKIADQTEKTGNTGQATLSLPPGKYPFGVTADGFEQAVGTFEVTANEESQLRVELKAAERGSKTVLTVSPSGKSMTGDKLELTATVTMGSSKTVPPGYIRFEVSLNKGSGGKLILAKCPVKDGKAIHTESKLPHGNHLLDATYVPTPETKDNAGSQSQPVPHNVIDKEYQTNLQAVQSGLAELKAHAQSSNFTKEIAAIETKLKEAEAKFEANQLDAAKKLLKALKSECSKLKTTMDLVAKGLTRARADQVADVSQSLVDSGVDREKALEVGQVTHLGGSGDMKDAKVVAAQVAKLPLDVIKSMRTNGTKVVACRGNVTDHRPELKGQTPDGWTNGKTWDSVPGLYMGGTANEVVIGTRGHGTAGGPKVPASGDGHGSFDLVTHEAMHGYDLAGGTPKHDDKAFQEARTKDLAKLAPYYTQPDPNGLEETYAESAARFFGRDPKMKTDWPNLYKYWESQNKK